MGGHKLHISMSVLRQPVLQMLFGVIQNRVADADLLKSQCHSPGFDLLAQLLKIGGFGWAHAVAAI
jgi:hypothetical protein